MVRRGAAWHGRKGGVWQGEAGCGLARQERSGEAWKGKAGHGLAGKEKNMTIAEKKYGVEEAARIRAFRGKDHELGTEIMKLEEKILLVKHERLCLEINFREGK